MLPLTPEEVGSVPRNRTQLERVNSSLHHLDAWTEWRPTEESNLVNRFRRPVPGIHRVGHVVDNREEMGDGVMYG